MSRYENSHFTGRRVHFALLRLILDSKSWSTTNLRQVGFRSPLVPLWMTVPFVSILQLPNPVIELRRLTRSEISWSTESIPLSTRCVAVARYLDEYPHDKVGYFGSSPNLTQVALGIQSVSRVNHPGDIFFHQPFMNWPARTLLSSM